MFMWQTIKHRKEKLFLWKSSWKKLCFGQCHHFFQHLPSSFCKSIIYRNPPACTIRFMFCPIFSLALNTAICNWATCWALFSIYWVANLTVHAFRQNWDKLLIPQMGKKTPMLCFWQSSQFRVRADLMRENHSYHISFSYVK